MNNNDQINSHESFGAIRISRGRGSPAVLFGSSIKSHSFIQIEISNCEEKRYLNTNWYHPTKKLIEFRMSENQFAQMLTQIGSTATPITFKLKPTGPTVKCEEPPYKSIVEQHANEFKDHLKNINEETKNLVNELNNILESSKLKKSDKEKLTSIANHILQTIQTDSEYHLDAFNEQMENTVTECKAEIESLIQSKANQLTNQINNLPKLLE